MRFLLAFSCFFRLLFGLKLNPKAAAYLPGDAVPKLPESTATPAKAKVEPAEPARPRPEPVRAPERKPGEHRDGALAMLGLLQREGRLIDFLLETIDDYDDASIGAAVRDIHRGCRKVLREHLELEAVMPGEEDEAVDVPRGFDPGEIRLVGDVSGDPPFHGVLRHH